MIAQGTCGNCTWEINNAGQLTIAPIEGTDGKLAEWDSRTMDNRIDQFSWLNYRNEVHSVQLDGQVIAPEDMQAMFAYCRYLTDISGLEKLDTSHVEKMNWVFNGCENLSDIEPLKNWDMHNVVDVSDMFSRCEGLTDLTPLKDWDVSSVRDMEGIFAENFYLKDLSPIEAWDVANVSNLRFAFCRNNALEDITPLSAWIEKVEPSCDVDGMFLDSKNLPSTTQKTHTVESLLAEISGSNAQQPTFTREQIKHALGIIRPEYAVLEFLDGDIAAVSDTSDGQIHFVTWAEFEAGSPANTADPVLRKYEESEKSNLIERVHVGDPEEGHLASFTPINRVEQDSAPTEDQIISMVTWMQEKELEPSFEVHALEFDVFAPGKALTRFRDSAHIALPSVMVAEREMVQEHLSLADVINSINRQSGDEVFSASPVKEDLSR